MMSDLIPGLEAFMSSVPDEATSVVVQAPTLPPQPLSVKQFSIDWFDPVTVQLQKNCPVYTEPNEKGGFNFSAYITGSISDVDSYLDLIDILFTATNKDTINIFLDSPGGMIASGGIISSAIDSCQAEVFAVVRGLCASAAALIMSSVKKGNIRVSPFSVVMLHSSSHADCGFSNKVAERAKNQVRYVNECLLLKALQEGHLTQEEFDRIQNGDEIFMSASEFKNKLGE